LHGAADIRLGATNARLSVKNRPSP